MPDSDMARREPKRVVFVSDSWRRCVPPHRTSKGSLPHPLLHHQVKTLSYRTRTGISSSSQLTHVGCVFCSLSCPAAALKCGTLGEIVPF